MDVAQTTTQRRLALLIFANDYIEMLVTEKQAVGRSRSPLTALDCRHLPSGASNE
jgi:hypothetical protein